MITNEPSYTTGGWHIMNAVIGGNTLDCSNEEYIKKVFIIEVHQPKKQESNPNNLITFFDELDQH